MSPDSEPPIRAKPADGPRSRADAILVLGVALLALGAAVTIFVRNRPSDPPSLSPATAADRPKLAPEEERPERPDPPRARETPADRTRAGARDEDSPDPKDPRSASVDPSGGRIEGRVVDLAGEPVPDATLLIWWAHPIEPVRWERPHRMERADAAGRFRLEGLSHTTGEGRTLTLCAESADSRSAHCLAAHVPRDTRIEDAILVLAPRWDLEGKVFNPHGGIVSEAEVLAVTEARLYDRARATLASLGGASGGTREGAARCDVQGLPSIRSRTASDGSFRLSLNEETWHIRIRHPGYPEHAEWVWDERHIDVWLEPGATLAGTVTSAEGYPVEAVEVRVFADGRRKAVTRTDGLGQYRLEGLDPDTDVSVCFLREGYALHEEFAEVRAAEETTLDVALGRARSIEGRVVDASGAAVEDAEVILRCDTMTARLRMSLPLTWRTGPDGRFAFEQIGESEVTLIARRKFGAEMRYAETSSPTDGAEVRLVLVPDPD